MFSSSADELLFEWQFVERGETRALFCEFLCHFCGWFRRSSSCLVVTLYVQCCIDKSRLNLVIAYNLYFAILFLGAIAQVHLLFTFSDF